MWGSGLDLNYFFDHIKIFLLEYPSLSPTLFVLFHIVFAICLLPCSPMGLIAGALWGKWLGLGVSILAAFYRAVHDRFVVLNAKLEATGFKTSVSLDDGIRELIKGYTMTKNTVHGNV